MLFILNRTEEIVGVLHNNGDTSKVTPYFEDVHTEELETGAETFEFKTIANTKDGYYLQVGNYIAFRDEEDYKVFTITEIEEEHEEIIYKRVYCEGVCLELLNDVIRPRNFASTNITNFMKSILTDTAWNLGVVDMAIVGVQSIDITDYVSVYKALQSYVIGTFECEIKFRIQIANHRIVGRYIDVYKQRGKVTKKRFEYGVNMTKVKRTVDTSELVTALIGVGNNGTTFKSVSADDKPLNQDFIVDQDAYDRWNNNGKHIMGTYKHDTDSPQELLLHTRKELKRRAIPKITYDLDVELLGDKVGLGDTVFVIDTDFSPQLLLSARVSVLEKSQTDGNSNKCKLTNFKEVRSNITDDMRELANQLQGTIDDKINSKFPVTSENLGEGAVTEGKIEPQYLSIISADIVKASMLETEKLISTKAEIEDLKVVNGEIEKLKAVDLDVTGKLTATEGEINILKGKTADFEHIFSGNITADMIQTGTIQSGSSIIANGAIGSAQISDLSASKISSGTIDTSNINIQGANGMLKLRGNRLQVFTGTGNQRYERVSLGDVYNDGSYYGLLVRGADGNTVLFDENGITEKGITDGLITNEHISEETQIDGSKLDISSVIREINGDTEKINGHAVLIEGSTLSTKLSEIIITQTEDGKKISNNASKIDANEKAIKLKVDSQTYSQDKQAMEETLSSNTSSIEQLEKDIKLKVEQTDIKTAMDKLQIGAVNYALQTKEEKEIQLTGITNQSIHTHQVLWDVSNKEVVISFDYEFINLSINETSALRFQPYSIKKDDSKQWTPSIDCFDGKLVNGDSNGHVEFICTLPPFKEGTELDFRFRADNISGTFKIKNVQVELGNKATNWKPNPQDLTTEITNVKSELTANLDGFKTQVSKNYYTKDDVDNKGYATSSQVNQTVNGLEVKISQSGGYNKVKNGLFKKDLESWVDWGVVFSEQNIQFDTHANGDRYIRFVSKQNGQGLQQVVEGLTVGKKYTLSAYCEPNNGVRCGIQVYNQGAYPKDSYIGVGNGEKPRLSVTFTAKHTNCVIYLGAVNSDPHELGVMRFWNVQFEEGELATVVSPNPNELYTGITTIDANGITVSMDEGQGTQGYTRVNHEGLAIYDANNLKTPKAFFGQGDVAQIDVVKTNDVICDRVIRKNNSSIPLNFYVSPVGSGDRTGRDGYNKADSINSVLSYIKTVHGQYIDYNGTITIHIENGTYTENVYVVGFIGMGTLKFNFHGDAVFNGCFMIYSNTPHIYFEGQGYGTHNGGTIIYSLDTGNGNGADAFYIRQSHVFVNGFRIMPKKGAYYSWSAFNINQGGRLIARWNDMVGFNNVCHMRLNANSAYFYSNRGDVKRFADVEYGHVYTDGGYPLTNLQSSYVIGKVENLGGSAQNSLWKPKDSGNTAPPVTTQWVERTFTLTNLRTVTEGSGSSTSNKSGVWGQGKWGSYKAHRGYADIPSDLRAFCNGAVNINMTLTMTRQNTSHGNAGATPVPKLIISGSSWSSGVAYARGDRKSISLPSNFVSAISGGSLTTMQMFSNTTSDYSFYENVQITVKCQKQV